MKARSPDGASDLAGSLLRGLGIVTAAVPGVFGLLVFAQIPGEMSRKGDPADQIMAELAPLLLAVVAMSAILVSLILLGVLNRLGRNAWAAKASLALSGLEWFRARWNRSAGSNSIQGQGGRQGRTGGTADDARRRIWVELLRPEGFPAGGCPPCQPACPMNHIGTAQPSSRIITPSAKQNRFHLTLNHSRRRLGVDRISVHERNRRWRPGTPVHGRNFLLLRFRAWLPAALFPLEEQELINFNQG